MNTIVIGAAGFIGNAFLQASPGSLGTHYKPHPNCQFLNLENPRLDHLDCDFTRYETAIVAGGICTPRQCYENEAYSYRCNVSGTLALAEQLLEKNITPVLFSTDYVFDGRSGKYREDSPVGPLNPYGEQKAALERELEKWFSGRYLLIRLSRVYDIERGSGTLIDEIASKLIKNQPFRAAYDQVFSPVHIDDVVQSIHLLLKKKARGIFHLSGKEVWSRLEIAKAIQQRLNKPDFLIKEISLDDLNETFVRPKCTTMDSEKLIRTIGPFSRSLAACIDAYCTTLIGALDGTPLERFRKKRLVRAEPAQPHSRI